MHGEEGGDVAEMVKNSQAKRAFTAAQNPCASRSGACFLPQPKRRRA